MSSMQVDNRERGFAYAYDAPLDMRMDPSQELTAYEIINTWDRRRLARTIRDYGEERFADRIAGEIVRRRARAELNTTFDLNEAITAAIPAPARFAGGHPAKRTFQAIRIAVNGELAQLDEALPLAWEVLQDRRPARRALLPFARGPARQALPRRPRARVHLPARAPDLRVRQHAGGGARPSPLDRRHTGRGRGESPFEVGSAEGRTEAQRGASWLDQRPSERTATRTAPLAPRRVSGPVRRPVPVGPPVRGRTGAVRAPRADPGSPDHRPPPARSRLCIWVIGIMLGGIVFMQVSLLRMNTGISARGRDADHARAPERDDAGPDRQAHVGRPRSATAAIDLNMIDPPAGNTRYLHLARERRRLRGQAHTSPRASAPRRSWPTTACCRAALAEPGTAGALVAEQLNATPERHAGARRDADRAPDPGRHARAHRDGRRPSRRRPPRYRGATVAPLG